jgi:DNA repair protein RadC
VRLKEVIHVKIKDRSPSQPGLSTSPTIKPGQSKFISSYRVTLVHDRYLPFKQCRLNNSEQAHPIIRTLIKQHGQSDREQFCVLFMNAKNAVTGANIVATGGIASAQVSPREVIKPAILANALAVLLGHNHPSGDPDPSPEDIALTKRIVQACLHVGIVVHDHVIVSMLDDRYYSFADKDLIKQFYDEID